MFCPKCRSEFVDLVDRCSDCNIQLVEKLGPEPPKLKMAVLSAALGLLYLYEPIKEVFGINVSLIISFVMVGFFHTLYRQFEATEHKMTKSIFAGLIGAWGFSLLHMLDWINLYVFNSQLYSKLYTENTMFFLYAISLLSVCIFFTLYRWIIFWVPRFRLKDS